MSGGGVAIERAGGVIVKFIGDAALVVFSEESGVRGSRKLDQFRCEIRRVLAG